MIVIATMNEKNDGSGSVFTFAYKPETCEICLSVGGSEFQAMGGNFYSDDEKGAKEYLKYFWNPSPALTIIGENE